MALAVGPSEVSLCILIESFAKPPLDAPDGVAVHGSALSPLSRALAVFLLREIELSDGAQPLTLSSLIVKLQQELGDGGVALARHLAQRLERLRSPDDINQLFLVSQHAPSFTAGLWIAVHLCITASLAIIRQHINPVAPATTAPCAPSPDAMCATFCDNFAAALRRIFHATHREYVPSELLDTIFVCCRTSGRCF